MGRGVNIAGEHFEGMVMCRYQTYQIHITHELKE